MNDDISPRSASPDPLVRARFLATLYGLDRLAASHYQASSCTSDEHRGLVASREDQRLAAELHQEIAAGPNDDNPGRFDELLKAWEAAHDPAAAIERTVEAWRSADESLTRVGATDREVAQLISIGAVGH